MLFMFICFVTLYYIALPARVLFAIKDYYNRKDYCIVENDVKQQFPITLKQGSQYFLCVPVLHYLQAVLFLKILTFLIIFYILLMHTSNPFGF